MANLQNIVYISNEDYETLVTTGSVTIGGVTHTYDPNNVYITPDDSPQIPTPDTTKAGYVLGVGSDGNYTLIAPYNEELGD